MNRILGAIAVVAAMVYISNASSKYQRSSSRAFALGPECNAMRVYSYEKTLEKVRAVYRASVVFGGPKFDPSNRYAAFNLADQFFISESNGVSGCPSSEMIDVDKASISKKLMYFWVCSLIVSYMLEDGRIDEDRAAEYIQELLPLYEGTTQSDWVQTFGQKVPWPGNQVQE